MHRRTAAMAVLGIVSVGAFGCGSSSSGTSSSGAKNSSGFATAALERLYKGATYQAPPSQSPPPAKNKSVWVFSCGQAIQGCSVPAAATVEAAKALGWNVTLYDTQLSPSRIATGVRSAVAAKADGIIEYSLDCPYWPAAITLAHKAGIKIVGGEALQCTNADQPRLDAIVSYAQGPFAPDWFRAYGAAQADNVIAKTNGSAKVIYVHQTDVASFRYPESGMRATLKKCGDCAVVAEVDFKNDDVGAGLQQKIQEAILKHPEANAMIWDWDIGDIGGLAALRSSGRANKIVLAVGQGLSQTISAIRSGRVNGIGVGIPEDWEGYSSVDNLNRLFQGQKPVTSGIGLQSFDKSHSFPSGDTYQSPIDFKAAYRKAWGIG